MPRLHSHMFRIGRALGSELPKEVGRTVEGGRRKNRH